MAKSNKVHFSFDLFCKWYNNDKELLFNSFIFAGLQKR